jgi:hypothetical protein
MAKLTDLGFLEGIICETIVSTYSPDGSPNAAPMGATMQTAKTLNLNIYNSSQTSRNLKTNKFAVINLTSDIEVFYKTAFKETNTDGKLPKDWFQKSRILNAPILQSSEASVSIIVAKIEPEGTDITRFTCQVKRIETAKTYPQAYSRARALTLEAIVHATRVKAFAKDKKQQKTVEKLLALIQGHNEVINRVAPNSTYTAVMADLMRRIDSWRNQR